MPPFGGARYLRCFYCGQQSRTRYSGQREFLCLTCDATNYLDRKGDITDPPVSTTTASTLQATQYAVPRSISPDPTPSQSIFCQKCLKNQHLFTSSLAQYLPDDPDDPDYEQLESNYYKFRSDLERRYPQACADCEVKVNQKLQEAGYTARTDHLRRMVERGRTKRSQSRGSTRLDFAETCGRWLWWTSLLLQLLWHFYKVDFLVREIIEDGNNGRLLVAYFAWTRWCLDMLPSAQKLIQYSFRTSVLCLWWNPMALQVIRGFSQHILGLRNWYLCQVFSVFLRYLLFGISQWQADHEEEIYAQLGIHGVMAFVSCYIYYRALKTIATDTTPLFGTAKPPPSPIRPAAAHKPTRPASRPTHTMTMANVLDEMLENPSPQHFQDVTPPSSPLSRRTNFQVAGSSPLAYLSRAANTSSTPRHPRNDAMDEMDWTPTHAPTSSPPPPALMPLPNHQSTPFGHKETTFRENPFRTKVPPAPKTPAQRLFTPKTPATQTVEVQKGPFQLGGLFRTYQTVDLAARDEVHNGQPAVSFAAPSFKPNLGDNDPRNSLADMLDRGFSLSPREENQRGPGAMGRQLQAGMGHSRLESATVRNRVIEACFLVIVFSLWAYQIALSRVASPLLLKSGLTVCVLSALHSTGSRLHGSKERGGATASRLIGGGASILELAVVLRLAMQVWTDQESCSGCVQQALGVTGAMLAHRLWSILA